MRDRAGKKTLSRRGKILRNFLLAALAGFFVWLNAGAPMTPELELRRLERENFFTTQAQFLGDVEADGTHWGIGLTDRWLVLGVLDGKRMELWPREEPGPVLAPVPDSFAMWREMYFVAADVPEGTVSAQLSATISCWYTHTGTDTNGSWSYSASQTKNVPPPDDWQGLTPTYWEKTYTMEGEPLEAGAFLFRLEEVEDRGRTIESIVRGYMADWDLYLYRRYGEDPDRRDVACAMTAIFYDQTGNELGRTELTDAGGGM